MYSDIYILTNWFEIKINKCVVFVPGKSAQWRQAKGRNKQVQREMIKRRGAEKEATDADTVMDKSQTVTAEEEEECSSVSPDSTSAPTPPPAVSTTPSPIPISGSAAEETALLDSGKSSTPAVSSQVNLEAPLISSKTNNKVCCYQIKNGLCILNNHLN